MVLNKLKLLLNMSIDHKKIKLILILLFTSITASILIIKDNVATGYESSIFNSFPILYYFFVATSMLLAGFILWYINIKKINEINNFYIFLTIYGVFFEIIVFSFLPLIKGYFFYPMGDVPSHLGRVIDILETGYISPTLIYPIEHIYIAIFSQISSFSLYTTSFLLKPLSLLLYGLFIYVLSLVTLKNINQGIVVTTIAIIQTARIQQTPHEIAALFLPLVFYLYFKTKTASKKIVTLKILMAIFILIYPIFHPLNTVILVFSLVTFDITLSYFIYPSMKSSQLFVYKKSLKKMSLFPIIGLIVLLMWLWNHYWFWNYQIGRVLRWLITDATDEIGRYNSVTSIFNIYGINPFSLTLKYYFIQLLIFLICSICLVKIYSYWFLKRKLVINDENFAFITLSSFILLMLFFSAFSVLSPTYGGPERMFYYATLISPIYFVRYIFNLKTRTSIALVLIIIIFITGPFLSHQSNVQDLPNLQVTSQEYYGMDWFTSVKNETVDSLYNHERPFRLASLKLGTTDANRIGVISSKHKPLPHFGYSNYSNVGKEYSEDTYLLLSKYDYYLYLELYKKSTLYTLEDFVKIENDFTVYKIYENNEFKVYEVKEFDTIMP